MSDIESLFMPRRVTRIVHVGGVAVGGGAPIVVQSMTNTDTADIARTVAQVKALADAGSEVVRVTVNTFAAAKAVPSIRDRLAAAGCTVPLIGDFHYNGHQLLTGSPACAEALAKYRINPGSAGNGRDSRFAIMIEQAMRWNKPVRIGVGWETLDAERLARIVGGHWASGSPADA